MQLLELNWRPRRRPLLLPLRANSLHLTPFPHFLAPFCSSQPVSILCNAMHWMSSPIFSCLSFVICRPLHNNWLHQIRIYSDLCSYIPTPISQKIPISIYRDFASPLPSLSFSHRTKDSKSPDFLTLSFKGMSSKKGLREGVN